MDQDAFRNLLATSRKSQLGAQQGTPPTVPQKAATSGSQPTFKPRKVKKADNKYRDRAAERRDGIGNDYAQIEAVLEDFQRRAAHEDKDVVEQQRKYLGGDSEHTILVKGLDVSLLEQNRARTVDPTADDEMLEQAFTEHASTSQHAEPKKRTRQEIIRDLKAKRQNGNKTSNQPVVETSVEDNGSALEAAKKAGKFRPVGFKPIGQVEEKPKKRKVKVEKAGTKKKKQKVESVPAPPDSETRDRLAEDVPTISQECSTTEALVLKAPTKSPEREPTPPDADFDIFAGAGDYEGFVGNEQSDEEYENIEETQAAAVPSVSAKGWFDESEPEVSLGPEPVPSEKALPVLEAMEAEEESHRLQPLESSALPSIRDFLAMDEAVEKAEKRKARKEKKKKKKKGSGDDDDD